MSNSISSTSAAPAVISDPKGWVKLLIWAAFIALIYAMRDFFLVGFVTFLICFCVRTLVDGLSRRIPIERRSLMLDRVLTLGVLLGISLGFYSVGRFIVPQLMRQYNTLVTWLQHTSAEDMQNTLLSQTIGAIEFKRLYGTPGDPRYQSGMEKFQAEDRAGQGLYNRIPQLSSRLRAKFEANYELAQIQHLRSDTRLSRTQQGPFKQWFLQVQAPQLFHARPDYYLARWQARPQSGQPMEESTTTLAQPNSEALRQQMILEMIWQDINNDPVQLSDYRSKWEQVASIQAWEDLRASADYQSRFKQFYEQQAQDSPQSVPVDYAFFQDLTAAYAQGKDAFLKAVRQHDKYKQDAKHRAYDFESATKLELGQQWWASSYIADWLREHAARDGAGWLGSFVARVEHGLHGLVKIPLEIGTALLLAVFILLGWDGIGSGISGLRDTRLKTVYDELAPAVLALGKLIGKSFGAQVVISVINAGLMLVGLWLMGIEYRFVLTLLVFLCSFIPVVGVLISGVPICAVAILQPNGSLILALQVIVAIAVVHLLEAMVFSPRIVGRIGELHPVLVIAILLVAEHFFGMWGLILGVPISIYLIRVVILGVAIPGVYEPPATQPASAE